MQICKYSAKDVLQLLNPPHQHLTLNHHEEIQKQRTLEGDEVPEPKERTATVLKFSEGLGLFRVFENISSNEQRASTTGQGIASCLLAVRRF
jgi:hypothetical protein